MFDWSDLRIFLTVQRAGSLSAAARELRINQTTAGRRLAELEHALGVRLFDRVPSGVALTAAGEELLAHAESMEERALAVERAVGARDAAPAGVVRLTCLETFGSRFLAPRLAPLAERHPGLRLELLTSSRVLDLARRKADVAVRLGKPTEPSVAARRLGTVAFALYASPALLRRGRKGASLDLGALPFLAFEEGLAFLPEAKWLERWCGARDPALRTNSTGVQFEAAQAGLGAAVLPCWIAEGSGLARVSPPGEVLERELWTAVHPDLRKVARIRAVVDFLRDLVEREAPLLTGRSALRA